MILLLTGGFFLLGLIDLPKLAKRNRWREFFVSLGILLFSYALALLLALDVKVPSPLKLFVYLTKDMLGIAYPPN